MTDTGPRHALETEAEASKVRPNRFHKVVAHVLLLGGRILPLLTLAVVIGSSLTRDQWHTAPRGEGGFTTAGLPTASGVLLFCFGMALPFIILPVGSIALAIRDGDRLTVRTVLGRRTVRLSMARMRMARIPGRGPDTFMLSVRSGWHWAILSVSESWFEADFMIMNGHHVVEDGWRGDLLPTIRGWVFMILWVLVIFITVIIGGVIAGTF